MADTEEVVIDCAMELDRCGAPPPLVEVFLKKFEELEFIEFLKENNMEDLYLEISVKNYELSIELIRDTVTIYQITVNFDRNHPSTTSDNSIELDGNEIYIDCFVEYSKREFLTHLGCILSCILQHRAIKAIKLSNQYDTYFNILSTTLRTSKHTESFILLGGLNPPTVNFNSVFLNLDVRNFKSITVYNLGFIEYLETNPDLAQKIRTLDNFTFGSSRDTLIHNIELCNRLNLNNFEIIIFAPRLDIEGNLVAEIVNDINERQLGLKISKYEKYDNIRIYSIDPDDNHQKWILTVQDTWVDDQGLKY